MITAPQYAYPDHLKQDILDRIAAAPNAAGKAQREALFADIRELTGHLLTRRHEENQQQPNRKPVDLMQEIIDIDCALIQAGICESFFEIGEIPGWDLHIVKRPEPEADSCTIVE